MRPYKHVAPDPRDIDAERFQDVIGTSLVRFPAAWGSTPVVATTEVDRICLAYWDAALSRWRYIERPHEPLTFLGPGPAAANEWNWSARVALAASRDAVYAVFIREQPLGNAFRTGLRVERFAPVDATGASRELQLVDSTEFFVDAGRFELGRSLWADYDAEGSQLLVLFQGQRPLLPAGQEPWSLYLQRVTFANGVAFAPLQVLAEGGFDFAARRQGRRLYVVHRKIAAAIRFPLIATLGDGLAIESGPAFDPFYTPLHLLRLDLEGALPAEEAIPGGEHPQIQSIEPLLITFDRHRSTEAQLLTPLVPLPPARPRFAWREGDLDKVAWLRDAEGDSRGVLLTDSTTHVPLPLAAMSQFTRMFEVVEGVVEHCAPFDLWPTPFIALAPTDKGYVIDLLHHRSERALYRTRLRIFRSGGEISVGERTFEVWDIGHAQMGDPSELRPDATAENEQFAPFGGQALVTSPVARMRAGHCDNTMGGFLAVDVDMVPVGFYAYTDLGDGGLRVIFAPDIRPLPEPPPNDNEKVLRPEQVTGPPIPCDVWVELRARDWTRADLPGYDVGAVLRGNRSLGAAIERAVDTLLEALQIALGADTPSPADGITDDQFDAVDAFRADLAQPLVFALTGSDGQPATITLDPGVLLRTTPFTATLVTGAANPNPLWTIVPDPLGLLPPGAIAPGGITTPLLAVGNGNPVTLSAVTAGAHRLSVFFTGANGAAASAFTNITAAAFVRDMVWALHEGIAESAFWRIGDLDFSVLQYDLGFRASRNGDHERVLIGFPDTRRTRWRFRGGQDAQGVIDYRADIAMATTDMELRDAPGLLFAVKSFGLTFSYARVFTPGMLMRDTRVRDALTGANIANDPNELVQRRDPLAHAALAAKPFDDSSTPSHETSIDLDTQVPFVAISLIVAALLIIGATVLAATVIALGISIAAAISAGILGAAALAAALATLAILLIFVAPALAEAYVRGEVTARFDDETIRQQLDDQNLLRYAGEGLAEAVGRKALERAREDGFTVPAPFAGDEIGRDRFRGQLFQMVFVTEGVCRVLLRLDECREAIDPGFDVPEQPGDDGPGAPDVVPGIGERAMRRRMRNAAIGGWRSERR